MQDSYDYRDAKTIFDNLWAEAFPLTGDQESNENLIEQIEKFTWIEQRPSPYLLYIRTLYEYFRKEEGIIKTPKELTRDRMNQYFDVAYQTDAIQEGVYKIKKHSGVIIADVVGLGKSIIAASIAANLDQPVVIVTPPHLKQQWEDYAADFGLIGHKIYTSGKLETAAEENKGNKNFVVIIDEAHRYRNEDTESYAHLHQLCAGNKVILLSATPFNNKPEDIFSLIKLFQIASRSTIQTVDDLSIHMDLLIARHKELKRKSRNGELTDSQMSKKLQEIASQIRAILDPVIIRRTRIDLEKINEYKKDLEAQNIQFSLVKPPKAKEYDLGDLTELYTNTLDLLIGSPLDLAGLSKNIFKGFTGARYKPLTYLKEQKEIIKKYEKYFEVANFKTGQTNLATFMQQLFVRRFESSKYSFIETVKNVLASMENLKNWYFQFGKVPLYKKGSLPDFDSLQDLFDDSLGGLFEFDDFLQSTLYKELEKGLFFVEAKDLNEQFPSDLENDIELFKYFISHWSKTTIDPKFDLIKKSIRRSLKNDSKRKIIIFTEFSDTAIYLQEQLKKSNIRSMLYTSKHASKTARQRIRENFDAGYPNGLQVDDYDVLVATDAISEGYSLHRAGTIYNYDIPYNPTRVIQRVGRINRVNLKVFDELFIFNFFPTATGETISHTAEISTFKMRLFQAILGSDTQILTEEETLEGYLENEFVSAQNEEDMESWDVPYRNELDRIMYNESNEFEKAINLPHRCRIARKNTHLNFEDKSFSEDQLFEDLENEGVLLFSQKGDSYRFIFTSKSGSSINLNPEQAFALFKSTKEERGYSVSDDFYPLYERAKESSGIVKANRKHSKIIRDARKRLQLIKKSLDDITEQSYVDAVLEIIELDSLPLFYARKLARIAPIKESVEEIKLLIPFSYLDKISEKNSQIISEPETILLAEELLGVED